MAMFALIIFVLLRMAGLHMQPGEARSRLIAVRMSPQSAKARDKPKAVAKARQASTQPKRPTPSIQPPPKSPVWPPQIIKLSRKEFAAADISKMSQHPDGDSGGGQDSGGAAGAGEGPGGAHLYNAEWYREPTHAELVTYLPNGGPPGSWGMIICRTIDDNHVEDCRELAESPLGSGLARALRRASWQFLVRPPRVDGRKMIGSWVRIRFDVVPPKPD